jgi:hypothetical protein
MQLIDKKLDQELSAFICGWHKLERRINKQDIIDIHLSKKVKGKEYKYQYEVLKDIEAFSNMSEVKNHPLISRKMNSHRYYLEKQMGGVIPFDEYLQNTMGVQSIIYSEKKIQTIREQTNELLVPFGLKVEEGVQDNFNKIDQQLSAEELIPFFNDHHNQLYGHIKEKTGLDVDFKIKYSKMDKPVSKIAELTGDGKNYKLLFNMYHMHNYGKMAVKHLTAHEISGHAVHFASLRKQYDEGKMPRYMTYVPTHESFMFSVEGLAETVHDFFPDMFQEPLMKAVFSFNRLRRVVANNATTMANRGENIKDCIEYVYKNCPNFPIGKAGLMLGFSSNKPLGSSYSQIYSQGMETFKEISESHPDKYAFIKSVYEDFTMPEQIKAQSKRSIVDFV